MRRTSGAFTLVELLVVVAIIAILAGILLPAVVQAKVSAKKAVSLSNLKQIVLGSLMYSDDFDDGLPLIANGNPLDVGAPFPRADTWVWTTHPYLKSFAVLVDPTMGDPHGFYNGGPNSQFWNQNEYPDYGENYLFLAPWTRDPSTGQCNHASSVTSSGGAHPSSTIFFTETYLPNEDWTGIPTGGYTDFGDWIVTAPAMLSILQSSPTYCIEPGMDWSKRPSGFNTGRPFTAEASQRYLGGGNNAMLDGHGKWLSSDVQAQGTDWATSEFGKTRIVDAAKYRWDYDGSFFGASPPGT